MHRKITVNLGAALIGALALAACSTTPVARRDAAPRVDKQVETRAAAFESFMRKARGIGPGFDGPAKVSDALSAGAAYEPRELEAGMIAYAALAALEEPRFADGVRKAARGRGGKDLARQLAARPDLARALPGGAAAAARASAALYRQGEALGADGRLVKTASYGVQRQAWAKASVVDPRGRLARVKQISDAGYRPAGEDRAQLYRAVAQGGARGGASSAVVERGVALAALTLLGDTDRGRALMTEPRSGMCLRMAKLNLYQCLASAGPYYEDIYCLGQHAMIDPGQCVTAAAQGRGA